MPAPARLKVGVMPRALSMNRHRKTSQEYREVIQFMLQQRRRLKAPIACATYRQRRNAWKRAGEHEETLGQIQHMASEGQLDYRVRR